MNWVLKLKTLVGTEAFWIMVGIFSVVAILAISLAIINKRRSRQSLESFRKRMFTDVFQTLRANLPAEQVWNEWLIAFSKLTDAENYFFYQADPISGNMHLRAVRSSKQNININNNFDKIVYSDAKQYRPPLMLNSIQAREQIQNIAGEKRFSLFWLREGKEILAMIQVGPHVNKWDPVMLELAEQLKEAMTLIQRIVLERLQMEKQTKEAININNAATLMRQSSMGSPQFIKQIMSQVLGSFQGDAAYLLKVAQPDIEQSESKTTRDNSHSRFIMSESSGLSAEDKDKIRAKTDQLPGDLGRMMTAAQLRQGKNLNEEPYRLFTSDNYHSMISVPLWANNHFWGLLVILAKDADRLNPKFLPASVILAKRMAMSMENGHMYREMTTSYIDTLKALVDYDDSLEPFTQGHSRQMASFAGEFAQALGHPQDFVDAIYLAGYLHDVGMSGFLRQMAAKQGSLTDQEMEQVRHHSSRGAILVEILNEHVAIAPFIKHHHERWDGLGYPDGLLGEQIPLGARILSVVDFFCAKITARSYRPAVPLKRALEEMEKAAGLQLDPYLVKAFADMWRKKIVRFSESGNKDGACHRLEQCPDFLTYACPSYQLAGKRCWETPGVLCAQHGDTCETCLVYTAHQLGEDIKLTRTTDRRTPD